MKRTQMKKICLLLVLCLCLSACSAFAEETADVSALIKESFRYIHDPRQNPNAMQDIVENPAAVYGFSPDPNSTRLGNYADYDWTDPAFVAEAKKNRDEYHASMESMMDIVYKMRDEGATMEAIAREVSAERNRLRLAASEHDPEERAKLKESNLKTYGNEEGPTPDQLYEKYGSWQTVLQKAFSPNLGMDAVCGLYDDYYDLYVELGLAEPYYEIYTGNDGEQYDLFEIRKLFYDENHKVYAVSGVYERVALDADCYYGKIAEDGAFTYDLALDFRAMMIDPETWEPLGPFLPVTDIYTWYIEAYLDGEAPESGELVFRYDLPEDEQETAEVDFWFITTRIRLNDRRQIEYMQYYYVPWA